MRWWVTRTFEILHPEEKGVISTRKEIASIDAYCLEVIYHEISVETSQEVREEHTI